MTAPPLDGRVLVTYDGPGGPAREAGMDGDQHEGWWARVPPAEVEVVAVTETEDGHDGWARGVAEAAAPERQDV